MLQLALNLGLRYFIALGFAAMVVIPASAQSLDTPIMDQSMEGIARADQAIIEQMLKLREEKKLLSHPDVKKRLSAPQPMAIALKQPSSQPLSEEEVARLARQGNFRVGFAYLCPHCDHWHLNLAGAYAVSEKALVTCDHVVDIAEEMREGYLIAVDHAGTVYPINAIVARNKDMDAAILFCETGAFTPLALQPEIKQGAASFCYSSPLGQIGYFSDGIVNRFYWDMGYRGGSIEEIDALRYLRINVSTDWAPGSSGAAVYDRCGNVIAHVSQIAPLGEQQDSQPLVTIHTGVPARAVKKLLEISNQPEALKALYESEKKK